MKKLVIGILVAGLVAGIAVQGYASDWDKAGKALAIIEGVRVLTGGRVDLIGNVTGINRNQATYARGERRYVHEEARVRQCPQRVWVPHIVWEKRYVPEHVEYREGYGRVIVGGHYIKCRAERGGHWEWK